MAVIKNSRMLITNLKELFLYTLSPLVIHLKSLHLSLFAFCFLAFSPMKAQYFSSKNYPKNYFRNPLGIPMQLSGNFGELRRDHFHMGLDLRTNQKENLPVFAAADGYISRIKIERFGYGRAIYITHPNGYTTLYAHLNNFYPELHAFTEAKQYKEEKWEQDFVLPINKFKVYKGQQIAWSGNTGGSQGPHLHFEIRDKNGNNQNPLLFGFPVKDITPPFIYQLFWYDRHFSVYHTDPNEIAIHGSKGLYTTNDSIIELYSNKISFGIGTEDIGNTSPFKFGIYQAEVWVDDEMKSAFQLNDFAYHNSRYINGSIDYKTKYSGGPYIQLLTQLPGNQSTIFAKTKEKGIIEINDTLTHRVEINVKDVAGNISNISFQIKYTDTAYQKNEYPQNAMVFAPHKINTAETPNLKLEFGSSCFYDTVHFIYSSSISSDSNVVSSSFTIGNNAIPVHSYFNVALKQTKPIADSLRSKVIMQLSRNGFTEAVKGEWDGDWMETSFNRFGTIQLLVDTIPPLIETDGWEDSTVFSSQKEIQLQVRDMAGEIQHFRAELDGKWLMFSRKDDLFIYRFDDRCTNGSHQLVITATDEAGNTAKEIFNFTKTDPPPTKPLRKLLIKHSSKKNKKNVTKRRK